MRTSVQWCVKGLQPVLDDRQNPKMSKVNRGSLINEVTITQGGKVAAAFSSLWKKNMICSWRSPTSASTCGLKERFSSITILRDLYEQIQEKDVLRHQDPAVLHQWPFKKLGVHWAAGTRWLENQLLGLYGPVIINHWRITFYCGSCKRKAFSKRGVTIHSSWVWSTVDPSSGWSCHSLTWTNPWRSSEGIIKLTVLVTGSHLAPNPRPYTYLPFFMCVSVFECAGLYCHDLHSKCNSVLLLSNNILCKVTSRSPALC